MFGGKVESVFELNSPCIRLARISSFRKPLSDLEFSTMDGIIDHQRINYPKYYLNRNPFIHLGREKITLWVINSLMVGRRNEGVN